MPRRRPERTMAMADARFAGGAKSAAKGISICGVTVAVGTDQATTMSRMADVQKPIMNETASKASTEFVTARPIDRKVVQVMSSRIKGRRLTRSPKGEMRSKPAA